VRRGVPFRKAHHAVGTLVAKAARAGTPLRKLPLDELRTCGPVQADVYEYLGCANVVRRYSPPGAGGARQLKQQLGFWRRELRRNLKD
jgi:argininosuccinate lyase